MSSSVGVLLAAVRVGLADATVGVLADAGPVREQDVLLSVRKLDRLHSVLLDALDRPVRENTLLLTVRKDALYCSVRET